MRLPWKGQRNGDGGVNAARAERAESERRLAEARAEVIRPLHEMRQRNHVGEMLGALIARRAEGDRGDPGAAHP
jgi:hypothetical protein